MPLLIGLIAVLGVLDAWGGRTSYLYGDTISYIDMARRIAQGDAWGAINGYWSPLFPIYLSFFIRPFLGDAFLEFTAVRIANLLAFGVLLFSFHVFLRQLLDRLYRDPEDGLPARLFSRQEFAIAAYGVFVWAAFVLNFVSRVSPDGSVAALVFADAALLLSFSQGRITSSRFLLFGVLLGVGYWIKAILVPVGVVMVLAALLIPAVRRVWPRLALTLLVWGAIAAPLVWATSVKYGHFTWGETGRINYCWRVDGVECEPQWHGRNVLSGTPVHPARQIFQDPEVYEFATPVAASYPPWGDPAYWFQGVKPYFQLRKQLSAIWRDLGMLAEFLFPTLVFPFVFLLLVASIWRLRRSMPSAWRGLLIDDARRVAPLWLAAWGPVMLYLCITIEGRYTPGFLGIAALLMLALMRTPSQRSHIWNGRTVSAAIVAAALLVAAPRLAEATGTMVRYHGNVWSDRWNVAREFRRLGVPPGTPVGSIGVVMSNDWPLISQLRVVTEVTYHFDSLGDRDIRRFWSAGPERQQQVFDAMRHAGARLVVAYPVPPGVDLAGWTHIAGSEYYYRLLDRP